MNKTINTGIYSNEAFQRLLNLNLFLYVNRRRNHRHNKYYKLWRFYDYDKGLRFDVNILRTYDGQIVLNISDENLFKDTIKKMNIFSLFEIRDRVLLKMLIGNVPSTDEERKIANELTGQPFDPVVAAYIQELEKSIDDEEYTMNDKVYIEKERCRKALNEIRKGHRNAIARINRKINNLEKGKAI